MKHSLAACRFLMAAALLATTASAAVFRQYDASLNSGPADQGWADNSGQGAGVLVNDAGQMAWRMNGNNCCAIWHNPLTAQELLDSFTDGWTLSALVRASSAGHIGYLVFHTGPPYTRFDITYGFDGTNTWFGLPTNLPEYLFPSQQTQVPGNGYHLVELRYSPITSNASLWINGVQQLTGYTGMGASTFGFGPAFGAFSFSPLANTQVYVANMTFSSNTSVPEPGTWALCGAALLGLGLRWRQARRSRVLDRRSLVAMAAGFLLLTPAEGATLIRNGSFETVPCTPCGGVVAPSEWLQLTLSPETYSNDGSYGVSPGYFGHFPGVVAQDGIRWVAGGSFPEILGQLLTEALMAGQSYSFSGWVHRDIGSLPTPGGWQVELWSDPSGTTQAILGQLAPVSGDVWTQRSFDFVAPANAASLPYLALRQIAGGPGLAYPGLDNIVLAANGVPEPATMAMLGLALVGFGLQRRRQ